MKAPDYLIVLVLAILAGFLGGLGTRSLGQMQAPVLPEARAVKGTSFQLVDEHDTVHAALDTMEGGSPALLFYDADHQARVVFEMTGNGDPRLFLMDQEGRMRTVLGLGLDADGAPSLRMLDGDRNVIWATP